MALDIGYVSAIGAGAISFLSPCVLPLVPPYLCYMAGVSVDDFRAEGGVAARAETRGALLYSSAAFVLGFSTVFVALGAGASAIGQLPDDYQTVIVLRHMEGLTFPQVAERMGKSVDSVEKLWMRALGQLRKQLTVT